MTPEQKAAFVMSQTACALAEIEAMKAANTERERAGYALAYGEESFLAVIERYSIGHNAVIGLFHG